MFQMKRRSASDILGVIEKIRYASEMSKAEVLFSKIMMDEEASLMNPENVVAFLYLERYYQRAGGNASLSILVTQEDGQQVVTIISPTSRETLFLDRADIAFSECVKKVLLEIGFEEVMEWDSYMGGWTSAEPKNTNE